MLLKCIQGNVLDALADGLILTFDGSAPGMPGNIAHQFARRWPDAWQEIEENIDYPVPLGHVFDDEPLTESPFRVIIMASTLHHTDVLTETAKKALVRTTTEAAIMAAGRAGCRVVATSVMKGGWRLPRSVDAFLAMTEGYEAALRKWPKVELHVYALDQREYEDISSLARNLGWRTV